jgi:hypothetical protein
VPDNALGRSSLIQRAAEVNETDEFELVGGHGRVTSQLDSTVNLIPALAIPMDAKSIFECPKLHMGHLVSSIPEVTRLVTIGCRAGEHSFLELWPDRLNPELKIHVVSPGDPAGIRANLEAGGIRGSVSESKMTFTEFAEHGHFAELLQSW